MTSRFRSYQRLHARMERRWATTDTTPWNEIRADAIEIAKAALLRAHLDGVRTMIDLGCGGGDFLSLLIPSLSLERAVGIDCASGAIARARAACLYTGLHQTAIEQAPASVRGPFDLVMLGEVLYYQPDPQQTLTTVVDRFVGHGTRLVLTLAVGRDYFWPRDVRRVRRRLLSKGLVPLLDGRIDYCVGGVPKRMFGPLFPQTHKSVMVWARPAA